MEILPIFAPLLYSFQYPSESQNEYDRLMDLWTNPEYLVEYAKKNQSNVSLPVEEFVERVLADAETLEDTLEKCCTQKNSSQLNACFQPLHNNELSGKILWLQKKKCRFLRLYAIKIDENCFVITGGSHQTDSNHAGAS